MLYLLISLFVVEAVVVQPEESVQSIVIDLKTQSMAVYDENKEFVRFIKVSTGRKGFETPTGEFTVLSKDRNHKSSKYPEETKGGCPMPYALRFDGWSYWIHEGSLNSRSHGCIRVSRANARWLFGWVKLGAKVSICN